MTVRDDLLHIAAALGNLSTRNVRPMNYKMAWANTRDFEPGLAVSADISPNAKVLRGRFTVFDQGYGSEILDVSMSSPADIYEDTFSRHIRDAFHRPVDTYSPRRLAAFLVTPPAMGIREKTYPFATTEAIHAARQSINFMNSEWGIIHVDAAPVRHWSNPEICF